MSQEFTEVSVPPEQTESEPPRFAGRADRLRSRAKEQASVRISGAVPSSPVTAPVEDLSRDQTECDHPGGTFEPRFSTSDYISGERFLVGYCNRCHLHVTAPVPGNVEKYYPSSYYGSGRRFNPVVEWLLNNLYAYRARQIESKQNPGKVLDIGCGRGLLLNKLRERGWEPRGTELSEEAAAYARQKLNLPVTTEELRECHFPDDEFDLVILWHVLEHVKAPRAMLQEVSRILKPGGVLLVAVPNFASFEARRTGPGWFHLDVPRHLTHFTPRTLGEALGLAGLSAFSQNFFSTEYDFFSFVQSAQNRMGFTHNYLYNFLRTRSARVLRKGRVERVGARETALVLLTAIPLALVSLVATPFLAALGQGGTIAMYAIKPRR